MIRLLDIVLAGLALVALSPLLIPVMVVLKCTGEGKVFYRQQRVGKEGKHFALLKFATMLENSPNMGPGLLTLKDDPRVLPVGRFLRKTKINELPQLVNVLRGDMSIIGPRPQAPAHFDVFPKQAQEIIKSVKPGLSGIGSIAFRDEENIFARAPGSHDEVYRNLIAPYKAELEIWYIRHQGVVTYLLLIVMTMWVVVLPRSDLYRRLLRDLPPAPEWMT